MKITYKPLVANISATYGEWFDHIDLNGVELHPERSLAVFNHSPDGFAWGYGGSGPSQLALAILLEMTADEHLAVKYHHDFKNEFIAIQPQRSDWELTVDVGKWIHQKQSGSNGE